MQRQGTLLTAICEKQEEKLQRQNEKIEKLEEQNETLRSIISRQYYHMEEIRPTVDSLIGAVNVTAERIVSVHHTLIDKAKKT